MSGKETFSKSIIGAGHIDKGMPCQDYALSLNDNGVQILVVCDGHGGSTYVRSDKGARFAAIDTKRILLDFAKNSPQDIFSGAAMAVTAMPQKNPFIDVDGNKVRYEDLDETKQAIARQAKEYIKATEAHQDLQIIMNSLVQSIIAAWLDDVDSDARAHKFTKEEKKQLSDNDFRKAYGCTVLAFLSTPHYWLALQIGDGTIAACNNVGEWVEPVPGDCACFLNRTTSLCDRFPEKEFRYAFSGKGDFPVGVFLCSDGVEGSFARKEDLYGFYMQVMEVMEDRTADINAELEEVLPQLSANGSRDDVSIAGMVDGEWLSKNVDLWGYINQEKKFHIERSTWKSSINIIEEKADSLSIRLNKITENLHRKEAEFDKWRMTVEKDKKQREQEISVLKEDVEKLQEDYNRTEKELADKRDAFKNWTLMAKIELGKIEEKKRALLDDVLNSGGEVKVHPVDSASQECQKKPSAESMWE